MSRIENCNKTLERLGKLIDREPITTQAFEVALIRVILADIAVSLAAIADSMSKKESEEDK